MFWRRATRFHCSQETASSVTARSKFARRLSAFVKMRTRWVLPFVFGSPRAQVRRVCERLQDLLVVGRPMLAGDGRHIYCNWVGAPLS